MGYTLSKATLDVAICQGENAQQFTWQQFDNNATGFKRLLSWMKKHGTDPTKCFFCLEHTGHYTLALCCFLQDQHLAYTLVSPLHLKKSLGITRGKNDKVDAGHPMPSVLPSLSVCITVS